MKSMKAIFFGQATIALILMAASFKSLAATYIDNGAWARMERHYILTDTNSVSAKNTNEWISVHVELTGMLYNMRFTWVSRYEKTVLKGTNSISKLVLEIGDDDIKASRLQNMYRDRIWVRKDVPFYINELYYSSDDGKRIEALKLPGKPGTYLRISGTTNFVRARVVTPDANGEPDEKNLVYLDTAVIPCDFGNDNTSLPASQFDRKTNGFSFALSPEGRPKTVVGESWDCTDSVVSWQSTRILLCNATSAGASVTPTKRFPFLTLYDQSLTNRLAVPNVTAVAVIPKL